jgi:hypothetical protein
VIIVWAILICVPVAAAVLWAQRSVEDAMMRASGWERTPDGRGWYKP